MPDEGRPRAPFEGTMVQFPRKNVRTSHQEKGGKGVHSERRAFFAIGTRGGEKGTR